MPSVGLDLNLQTVPDSDERDAELAALVSEMRLNDCEVSVINERGPAGGAQVVLFQGPREEIEKVVKWYCELSNDADGWQEFTAEYVTD